MIIHQLLTLKCSRNLFSFQHIPPACAYGLWTPFTPLQNPCLRTNDGIRVFQKPSFWHHYHILGIEFLWQPDMPLKIKIEFWDKPS